VKNVIFSVLGGLVGACIFLGTLVGLSRDTTQVPTVVDIQQSIVHIEGRVGEQPVEVCSGYVTAKSHTVVTAAHCFHDGVDLYANMHGKDYKLTVLRKGDPTWDAGPDLMELSVDGLVGDFPVGLTECTDKPQLGDTLAVFGSPLGWKNNVAFGHVSHVDFDISAIGVNPKYTSDFIGYDGQLFPGNSGGPAVELSKGCVVGIAEAIIGANPYSNYGLNVLTPITQLVNIHA
jgi:S1-C subfamily serine protease